MSADMQSIKELHRGIIEGKTQEELDVFLWDAVLTYQDQTLHTLSGLEFSYTVKHKKNGEYSGELLVSRKETSKTLTRSSVLLAFHKVLEATEVTAEGDEASFQPPAYRGPKAIGQIFGISYIFSLFLEFGLIRLQENGRGRKARMKKC